VTTIKKVIQVIIDKISHKDGYKRAWLEKHWGELVGKEAGKHSRPYKIERNILFVSVDSSVWNQELFMKKTSIISTINKTFEKKIVQELKCQIGYFPKIVERVEMIENEIWLPSNGQRKIRRIYYDKDVMQCLIKKNHDAQ